MGTAIQASVFGFVKDSFGWSAILITIGALYIIMLVLTLLARKMTSENDITGKNELQQYATAP